MASSNPPPLPRRRGSQTSGVKSTSTRRLAQESWSHGTSETARTSTHLEASLKTPKSSPLQPPSNCVVDCSGLRYDASEHEVERRSSHVSVSESGTMEFSCARIEAFLQDYFEDMSSMEGSRRTSWELFFSKYCVPDYVFIRPSGNPVGKQGLIDMFVHDCAISAASLVSLDNVTVLAGNKSAIALFTADQVFTYRGKHNEDRAVFTCVLELQNDELKIVHEHRTAGKVIPKETRWSTQE